MLTIRIVDVNDIFNTLNFVLLSSSKFYVEECNAYR